MLITMLIVLVSPLYILSMEDIQKNIAAFLITINKENSPHRRCYKLTDSTDEAYLFPTTTTLIPIKEKCVSQDLLIQTKTVTPHLHIKHEFVGKKIALSFCNLIHNTKGDYLFEKIRRPRTLFDGFNINRTAVIAYQNNYETCYTIYILKGELSNQNHESPDSSSNINPDSCLIKSRGIMRTLTLHPDCDRLIYSSTNENSFYIHIQEFGQFSPPIVKQPICSLFRKVLVLGNTKKGEKEGLGEVYLGLSQESKLFFFWLDEHNKVQYAQQKHTHSIFNIAVDNAKKHGGLRHNLAILDTNKDLFFTDLLQPGNPKLVYGYHVKTPNAFNLYYENGECLIIGKKHFYKYPDNSNWYYASETLKKMDLSTAYPVMLKKRAKLIAAGKLII